MPWQYSPADPNRVEWLPEADDLWKRVVDDQTLTKNLRDGVIKASDKVGGADKEPTTERAQAAASQREAAGLCA